jgi:arsenate reductase-like glutaredoxin family protein
VGWRIFVKLSTSCRSLLRWKRQNNVDKYELIEYLRNLNEVALVELLNLTSTDIVDAFLDKIDERKEYIYKSIED